MAGGPLLFGIGGEFWIAAVSVATGQWFVGHQLGCGASAEEFSTQD